MNKISHDIFKDIHEGKWLKIQYRNKKQEIKNFWIGILDLDINGRTLLADGLYIGEYTLGVDDMPYIIGLGMDIVIDLH